MQDDTADAGARYRQRRDKAFNALNNHFQAQLRDATDTDQDLFLASIKIAFRHATRQDALFRDAVRYIPGGVLITSWYETLRKVSEAAAKTDSPAGKELSDTFARINALDDQALLLHPRGIRGGNLVRRVQVAQEVSGWG